jgi:hypothetical protein
LRKELGALARQKAASKDPESFEAEIMEDFDSLLEVAQGIRAKDYSVASFCLGTVEDLEAVLGPEVLASFANHAPAELLRAIEEDLKIPIHGALGKEVVA